MALKVYEIRNQTLKELFISTARLALSKLIRRHQLRPPKSIAHWDFARHEIVYTEIEQDIPSPRRATFIRGYARASALRGWKVIIEGA